MKGYKDEIYVDVKYFSKEEGNLKELHFPFDVFDGLYLNKNVQKIVDNEIAKGGYDFARLIGGNKVELVRYFPKTEGWYEE